jgi:hypothetical protein
MTQPRRILWFAIFVDAPIDGLLKAPSPGSLPRRPLKDHPATEKGERRIRSARLELKEQTSGRQFPVHQFLRPQQSNMNAQLYNFMATLLKRYSFRESTKVATGIA